MNYVALEQSVGAFLVAEPSFSPYSSFLFTTQFIFTIFSVLIIITAIFKISRVGAKQYVLQVYGQYNGKTMSTKEEWNQARNEIFNDFMKTVLGIAMLIILSLVPFTVNQNLLN
jgi:uncharacterized membrane protein